MKPAYYNEFEPYAAAWLRNLIAAGHLPAGDVDERSIVDVRGDDLRGYGACHFFAGIGGWPYALRLAGAPDEAPIWTGSCPCQPFSVAGKGEGEDSGKHLWPAFRHLIAECGPPVVFGEQVASKAGRLWLAGVRADLEALGYAVGAADLCAAGVSAPHIRQRLYWMADAEGTRGRAGLRESDTLKHGNGTTGGGSNGGMAHPDRRRCGLVGLAEHGDIESAPGYEPDRCGQGRQRCGQTDSWGDFVLIFCGDGKARRIEPGLPPLAHGVPARVGRLRAYGNAIVPPLAAEFMKAALAVRS